MRILRETAKKIRHADNTDNINYTLLERMNQNVTEIINLLLPDFDDDSDRRTDRKIFCWLI